MFLLWQQRTLQTADNYCSPLYDKPIYPLTKIPHEHVPKSHVIICEHVWLHVWSHVITCEFGTCPCGIFVRVTPQHATRPSWQVSNLVPRYTPVSASAYSHNYACHSIVIWYVHVLTTGVYIWLFWPAATSSKISKMAAHSNVDTT